MLVKLAFNSIRNSLDCSDRSLTIDDGTGLSCKFVADAILAEQEKELPADHPYRFPYSLYQSINHNFPLVNEVGTGCCTGLAVPG